MDETHTVYVCDRENHRVQVFTPNGEFLEMWTDIQRPMDIAEFREGDFLISEGTANGKPIPLQRGGQTRPGAFPLGEPVGPRLLGGLPGRRLPGPDRR